MSKYRALILLPLVLGEKVRSLKTSKADKTAIDAAVKDLLALKAKYKEVTGLDYAPPQQPRQEKKKGADGGKKPEQTQPPQQQKKKSPAPATAGLKKPESTNADLKKITRLGLEARKEDDLSEW